MASKWINSCTESVHAKMTNAETACGNQEPVPAPTLHMDVQCLELDIALHLDIILRVLVVVHARAVYPATKAEEEFKVLFGFFEEVESLRERWKDILGAHIRVIIAITKTPHHQNLVYVHSLQCLLRTM
ncbi:uncharacterized protein EV420DRAFT_1486410 [Desarmillaria tabescens]|uniref:Uncharacterized protein n=1 Tax=Armillaria tabescens TaxID=1929756 RepID=A0AA39JC20_ARMTA|nr:uncharacterized protein EV420DRAFT_1486410 [Desarmillaria tabescens]KAK0439272.1 hypothetical protein EV420DRAFT_1486410 [Desarmillaria tabescens]